MLSINKSMEKKSKEIINYNLLMSACYFYIL
jgi:hypothetical protein